MDTPGLIPGFNLSEVLGDESGTITFSQIYRWAQLWAASPGWVPQGGSLSWGCVQGRSEVFPG